MPQVAPERLIIRGPDEGQAVWFTTNRMTILARAQETLGCFGLVEALAPVGTSPPLHIHRREDESFWIIDGEVRVRCGDTEATAGPGSFVLLPRDVPHTFLIEGSRPARLLNILTPSGSEEFFIAAGRSAAGSGLPPREAPDIAALKAHAAQFGIEIIGPPMTAERPPPA